MADLIIRRIEDQIEVKRITATPERVEKVMRGIIAQMDREQFYVDDSEFGPTSLLSNLTTDGIRESKATQK